MSKSLHVLIVEDSEDDALFILHELRKGGYTVTYERVDTAPAMSAALDKQAWDVVISDYVMPHFSAPDALILLKSKGIDMPFIVVSGKIGEDIAVATMKAGAHDYIMKGNLKRLVAAVERELREAVERQERRRAEESIRRRLEFERTVSDISSRFVGVFDIDDAINVSLADMGRFSGASRACVSLLKEEGDVMDNTHEWCDKGVSPQIDNLSNLPVAEFPWWMGMLRKGEVIQIEDVSKMPAEAKHERETLERQQIKSLLVLPMTIGGRLGGFVGFDNVSKTGIWGDDDLAFLRICSEIMGSALERKMHEDALRGSEEKLKHYLESSPDAIYIHDLRGNLLYGNQAIERLTGYLKQEIIGKSLLEIPILSPEYLPKATRLLESNAEGKPTGPDEFELIGKDGRRTFVEISTYPIREGDKTEVIAIAHDITERKRMEEALAQSERNYRVLFESTLDGIFVLDAETMKAVLANQAAAKVYGFNSAEDAVGSNPLDFVHPEDKDRVTIIVVEDMFEKDLHRIVEVRSATKDGREVWISAIGTKTEYQGRSAGLLSIRDITARKQSEAEKQRLEEQLHLSSRLAAVGELSAGIAHELNNPLAAIKGFAQLLIGGDDLDETVKKDLEAICMEAQRATKITQDLLSFARRHEPEKRLISINEALAKSLDLCSYQMKVNDIELSVEFDPDLPKTMADFFQMQEVFVNIIVNAEQAMAEAHAKGKLCVKTQRVGEMIQIIFTDDGPGIADENLKRIFDPFFTTKEVGKGTGLGLSICYGLIEGHGGHIYAKSRPGEGATFVVDLPVVSNGEPG